MLLFPCFHQNLDKLIRKYCDKKNKLSPTALLQVSKLKAEEDQDKDKEVELSDTFSFISFHLLATPVIAHCHKHIYKSKSIYSKR